MSFFELIYGANLEILSVSHTDAFYMQFEALSLGWSAPNNGALAVAVQSDRDLLASWYMFNTAIFARG